MKMSSLVKYFQNLYKSKRETFTHFTSLQQFSRTVFQKTKTFVKMWEFFCFSPFRVFRTSVSIFDFLNSFLRVNTFRFPETFSKIVVNLVNFLQTTFISILLAKKQFTLRIVHTMNECIPFKVFL
jgi:hypothetical protein